MNHPIRRRTVYLDHAATTPMLPRGGRGDDRAARPQSATPSSLHASGRGRPPGRRGVARDDRAGARLPRPARWCSPPAAPSPTTSRSRASSGRAARADPRRTRILSHARSSTTPCSTRCTGSASTRAPRSSCSPVDRDGPPRPRRAARRRSSATRRRSPLVIGDVGQQRGRHASSRSTRSSRSPHAHGIPVHTDAVQAVGQVPVDFAALAASTR